MTHYYFVGTSLPPLSIGMSPDISFEELMHLYYDNLSQQDVYQVEIIRRYWDIQNIRHFWKKEPLERYGNLDENQETESLLTHIGLPDYVFAFTDLYQTEQERLRRFPSLFAAYFREEKKTAEGFLNDFLRFEWGIRLVIASFRAKRLNRDIVEEIQDEDPHSRLIAQILAQKDTAEWIAPEGYEELKALFTLHADNPLDLFQALCQYKFDRYETLAGPDLFSLRRLLAYMLQLILVEKWLELDKRKGQEKMMQSLYSRENP